MTSSRITLTAAPRSTVTHAIATAGSWRDGHITVCGRDITETWAGEMNAGIPDGEPTCKRCAADLAREARAKGEAARMATLRESRASLGVEKLPALGLTVGDGLAGTDGETWTWKIFRTVTAVRVDGDRVVVTTDDGESRTEWGMMDVVPFATRLRAACDEAGIPTGADGWPVIGHRVYAENAIGSGVILETVREWAARARAASMAAHPAGKARTAMRSGAAYRAGMPPVPGVWTDARGAAYVMGVCDWEGEAAAVTRVPLAGGASVFLCSSHRHHA